MDGKQRYEGRDEGRDSKKKSKKGRIRGEGEKQRTGLSEGQKEKKNMESKGEEEA